MKSLSKDKNAVLFFGSMILCFISIPLMSFNTILGNIVLLLGVLLYIFSRIFFLLRETFSIFKTKEYQWYFIPTTINIALLYLTMWMFNKGYDNYGFLLSGLMILIGVTAIIRKIIYKERFFWY